MRHGTMLNIAAARTIVVLAIVVMAGAASRVAAQTDERRRIPVQECIQVTAIENGTRCGRPESADLKLRNRCDAPIDARFCTQRSTGEWDCGSHSNMKPGETTSFYSCRAISNIWTSARLPGSTVPLLNPAEQEAAARRAAEEKRKADRARSEKPRPAPEAPPNLAGFPVLIPAAPATAGVTFSSDSIDALRSIADLRTMMNLTASIKALEPLYDVLQARTRVEKLVQAYKFAANDWQDLFEETAALTETQRKTIVLIGQDTLRQLQNRPAAQRSAAEEAYWRSFVEALSRAR